MRKKTFLILFALFFVFNKNVDAGQVRNIIQNEIKPTIKAIKEEVKPTLAVIREETRNEIRERLNQATDEGERKEIKNTIREENRGILDKIRNEVREKLQNLRFSAKVTGKIIEKGESFIKVEAEDGKNYQVNITEKTQLRRRFWGQSNLSEFSLGDKVNVIGRYSNEEKTVIDAVLIRNLSIQRRWGVFFGEVKTISENYLVIKTINRGDLTVYLNKETKLKNRKEESIRWSDIKVDHKIRVKGVWNKDLNEIREVEEIKDFSIPAILSPTQ